MSKPKMIPIDCNVQSTATEFILTVRNAPSSYLAVVSAYDTLESTLHQKFGLPRRPLPELIGYLRSELGITNMLATVHPQGLAPIPPGDSCI